MDRVQNLPAGAVPAIELPGLRFRLGEEIDMLRVSVRGFAAAEIAPRAAEIDRSNQFPTDLWKPWACSASRSTKNTAAP